MAQALVQQAVSVVIEPEHLGPVEALVHEDQKSAALRVLTEVIARHGFEIYISKAATVLDQVTDTFYLKDAKGEKISGEGTLDQLRGDLLASATGTAE